MKFSWQSVLPAYSQQAFLFYCAARQSLWPSFIAFEWRSFHSVWMKEGAAKQADLMEHGRGCVLDYYLQECSCFYCPFSSSSQEHSEKLTTSFLTHTLPLPPSSSQLQTVKPITILCILQNSRYLIASNIGRMWTLLILTVENEITFFYDFTSVMEMRLNNIAVELHWAHTKTCLWDWSR